MALKNPLGMVLDSGSLYAYAETAGYSFINRVDPVTGLAQGSNPWLQATLILWADAGIAYNTQIAIGGGFIGIVGYDSAATTLYIQVINQATGAVVATTAIASAGTFGCSDIAADDSGNFYVTYPAAAGTDPSRLRKYDNTGTLVWSYTGSTKIWSVCYDRINARILIAGNNINGAGHSAAIITSAGAFSSGGSPDSQGTWNCIRPDGRGHYRLGRSNAIASMDSAFTLDWTKTTTGFSGYKLAVADGQNTSYGSLASSRVTRSIGVLGGSVVAFDRIGSVAVTSGSLALNPSKPTIFSAQNGPYLYFADGTNYKRYNPITNAIESWTASAGTLPASGNLKPTLIATWRGRTVLALPTLWFMSRVGDPTDWNYGPATVTALIPASGATSKAGQVPDLINSLMPINDDVLIFGGDHSLWRMAGDPMAGGRIDLVSDSMGTVFGRPFCRDPNGVLFYFGSRGGVFAMPTSGTPVRISRPIDQRLQSVNLSTTVVRMAWEDRMAGCHLFLTPLDPNVAATHYWFDPASSSWWIDIFGNLNHSPKALDVFDADEPDDRAVYLGSWDGYVRRFDMDAVDDDGTAILSHVFIGPITGPDGSGLMMKDLQCELAAESADLAWSLHAGNTAAEALDASAVFEGTFSAGRNHSQAVRQFGSAMFVKVSNAVFQKTWSMEALRTMLAPVGPLRQRIFP